MRNERMTMLITSAEKERLTERAEAAGLSLSEFVRRAVEAFDVDSDEAVAALMLDEMQRAVREMNETLDRVNEKVERDLAHLRQLRFERDAEAKQAA